MSPVSTSTRKKPFLFDRSFDDPAKVYLPGEKYGPKIKVDLPKSKTESESEDRNETEAEAEQQPPAPPAKTFTEEQVEAAREEGYVKGHTDALEEAETARDHYVADAVAIISKSLDALEERQTEANRETGELALRMVYAVIETVLPDHAKEYVYDSVEGLVKDVLPLVYDEPTLVVRAHEIIVEGLQAKLAEVCAQSNFNGTFKVVSDYEFQPGDCRVEWEGGGADRNEARLWQDIRTIIAENIGQVNVHELNTAADETVSDDNNLENEISGESAVESDQPDDGEPKKDEQEGTDPSET